MAVTPRVPKETPMFDDGGRLTRPWIIFFEQLPQAAVREIANEHLSTAGELKATFGLVRDLEVDNDLTNHYIARSPGAFKSLAVNAKQPPSGRAARFTIDKSTDEGATWHTIFADPPGYIEIGADDSTRQDFTDVFAPGAAGTIAVGDLLRIGCLQAGSSTAGSGIEFVLRGA